MHQKKSKLNSIQLWIHEKKLQNCDLVESGPSWRNILASKNYQGPKKIDILKQVINTKHGKRTWVSKQQYQRALNERIRTRDLSHLEQHSW